MKKVVKVREVRPKIKVVEESKKTEEIEHLTDEEIPLSEDEVESISPRVRVIAPRSATLESAPVKTLQVAPAKPEEGSVRLYDVGRGLGNEAEGRRQYYGQPQTAELSDRSSRTINVRDSNVLSAGQMQGGNDALRGSELKRNYEPGTSKSKKRVGPWE